MSYLAVAYVIVPAIWTWYAHRHPALDDVRGITETGDGIPGDPINVALVGTQAELIKIMLAAKWYPADPLSIKSCLEIAEATVLSRPYDNAPVSSLYLFGRKEDLAFEQPVGDNPRHRHHVRFWKSEILDDGQPIWVGSAIYDQHVGFSHDTGQITHVTAPDIDAERDYLFRDLEQTGDLAGVRMIDGFHKVLEGATAAVIRGARMDDSFWGRLPAPRILPRSCGHDPDHCPHRYHNAVENAPRLPAWRRRATRIYQPQFIKKSHIAFTRLLLIELPLGMSYSRVTDGQFATGKAATSRPLTRDGELSRWCESAWLSILIGSIDRFIALHSKVRPRFIEVEAVSSFTGRQAAGG